MADLIKRQQSEPLQMASIVKNALSLIGSQKPNENGRKKSALAIRLSDTCSPAELAISYTPTLQSTLPALCSNLYWAYSQKDIPQLSTVAQAYGEEFAAETFITSHLVKVNEFVGAKNKLTDQQLLDLSYQILSEYWYLNLFEFIVFCGRLRSGKYEDFYGSIDPMRILKSLDDFCHDRWNDIERAKREEEKAQRELDEIERRKNSISFEDWYKGLSDDKKKDVQSNPYFARLVADIEKGTK